MPLSNSQDKTHAVTPHISAVLASPNRVHDVLKVLHRDLPAVGLVFEHLVRQAGEYTPQGVRIRMLEPRLQGTGMSTHAMQL